jgi:single-stranded-DNA-specific exonuclease
MGDAAPAVNLMKTADRDEARGIVAELIERNTARRMEQEEAVAACEALVDREYPDDDILLLRPPRVHEGVAGIVAGKIREKYGRPAIVLSRTDERGGGALRGSARSIAGVDIISLIRSHEDLLIRFGGHAMAAGFTLLPENEDALREALCADIAALSRENPELFSRRVETDADIAPEEASLELARALKGFEPTGSGNPRPVLRIAAQTPERLFRVGTDGQHLKFTAGNLECVMFARGSGAAELPAGEGPFDLYGSLEVNEWRGRESIQFILKEAVCSE